MNEQREEDLETWIQTAFEATKEDSQHYPVSQRLFLPQVDQIDADFEIEVLTDFDTLIDDESPEYGTCHEVVERRAAKALQTYLDTSKQGYGAEYSEAYAKLYSRNCGDEDSASREAFEFIGQGYGNSPDNPAYREARAACIRKDRSEQFADRCAWLLVENGYSFPEASKEAAKYEKAYQRMLGRGHSELRARMYAESVGSYSKEFAEIYSGCVEAEVLAGRNQDEAERFADIHATIILDSGEPDEDDPDGWRTDLWYRAKAEADYRYRPEFGDKKKFIETFDLIHQSLSESPEAGSREWFDEIEAKALQRIAAQDAYIATHGNLRGFKTQEEEPPVEPALPKPLDLRNMTDADLRAFSPESDDEDGDYREEVEYREWCEKMKCDPMDSESRDQYKEQQEGDSWDDMDENDRDGWTDNMNKD